MTTTLESPPQTMEPSLRETLKAKREKCARFTRLSDKTCWYIDAIYGKKVRLNYCGDDHGPQPILIPHEAIATDFIEHDLPQTLRLGDWFYRYNIPYEVTSTDMGFRMMGYRQIGLTGPWGSTDGHVHENGMILSRDQLLAEGIRQAFPWETPPPNRIRQKKEQEYREYLANANVPPWWAERVPIILNQMEDKGQVTIKSLTELRTTHGLSSDIHELEAVLDGLANLGYGKRVIFNGVTSRTT